MAKVTLKDTLDMSPQERLALADAIYDSLVIKDPADSEVGELTPDFKAFLEQRVRDVEADPDPGRSWQDVKADLQREFPGSPAK
ncbi:MAG: addiction module protein [Phycisphaerae bacterium]